MSSCWDYIDRNVSTLGSAVFAFNRLRSEPNDCLIAKDTAAKDVEVYRGASNPARHLTDPANRCSVVGYLSTEALHGAEKMKRSVIFTGYV